MTTPASSSHSTDAITDSQPQDWPGERNPNQWDVHDAHQVPEVSFQRRFKAALLLSDDAVGSSQSLPIHDFYNGTAARQYAYPLGILSDLPFIPDDDVLTQAQAQFFNSFKSHLFLSAMKLSEPSPSDIVPPYLKIALACLGIVVSKSTQENIRQRYGDDIAANFSASDLFISGDGLWGVMMEVDNREARLFESILAGCLFATYGLLSADEEFWDLSSATVAGTATMARRLRMHCEEPPSIALEKLFLEHSTSTSSLLMSYLFLADVIRAIHCERLTCISTKELFMRMPSSPYNFRLLYNCLVSGSRPLPSDLRADEDALLLLTGICADMLYTRHAFSGTEDGTISDDRQCESNPYAPLSSDSEVFRYHYSLKEALDRWQQRFGDTASKDILLMFYFCRLLVVFPGVYQLPVHVEYHSCTTPNSMRSRLPRQITSEAAGESMSLAWMILDNSSARDEAGGVNVSIWLPVALFFAALTVWYHLQHHDSSSGFQRGTLRTLGMFKDELSHLPWPCCAKMCLKLDELMGQPTNRSSGPTHLASNMHGQATREISRNQV